MATMAAATMRTAGRATVLRWAAIVGLAALALALPAIGNGYVTYMACLILINVIATIGLNVTVGYAGLLSIGHAAFVGMGAYVSALLLIAGAPLPVALVAAAVAAFLFGIVFGLPAIRIKGVHLAISTLAAQFTFYFVAQRWTAVTHGDNGLQTPQVSLFGFSFDSDARLYFLILPFAVASCLTAANLFRTRVGRAFIALRERDYAAEVLGVNVVYYKLLAFAVGATYAGIAGALLSIFLRLVNPDQFVVSVSIFYLTAVLVGGRGSILGSILGALFMTLLPEFMRVVASGLIADTSRYVGQLATFREFLFGALIVLFLHLDPRGLVGLIEKFGGRIEFRG
ncbi:MAG TPA: branched-chain amino acid ABC transporter permease [Hyphomicrobiales bacterium]|nr:branched-chain amino acid ABC transporter permease [Hyphomicrobiales bacterium]